MKTREFRCRQTTYRLDVMFGSVGLDVRIANKWRPVALGTLVHDSLVISKTYKDRCHPDVLRHAEIHLREMLREAHMKRALEYRKAGLPDLAFKLEQAWNLPPQVPTYP